MKDLLASVFRLFRKDDPQKPVPLEDNPQPTTWPFPSEEAVKAAKKAATKRKTAAKPAKKQAAKPATKTAKKAKK